ncbi:uncharacterized membrane protein YjjB (DUF3815 family) [Sediminitomix flava]|uniref:Uncharacterized membrane protein YjjB (DUF3815 family) n=2 Tax=Sediminitomix flava TaxID=379075 RepID=A0A315ZD08_SEDFL|nr:uncharacterized membrane protein YjjB (DUF3815 family) [Sediminitomix flava]
MIGAFGFGVIFNIKKEYLLYAGLGGFVGWLVFELMLGSDYNISVSLFFASCIVTVYSEYMARRLKVPATIIIICGIIPLVPGGAMYYTTLEAINGDELSFLRKMIDTMFQAGAIAIGIVLVSTVARIILRKILPKLRKAKLKKSKSLVKS